LYESNYAIDTVNTAASIKVMTCKIANVQGRTATATAMVLFPKVAKPVDCYRIVVWEHGTVGVGDGWAPSKNVINPRCRILADTLLVAGYVVIAPDYEGLGIADLAYGRTGDDGACLSYLAPDSANGLQEKFKAGILAFLVDPTHQITQFGIDLTKFKEDVVVQNFLAATQPATNSTKEKVIKTPVLLIQGEKDQAVLPAVTQLLVKNMKENALKFFP
jgi:dipeptidyl aminopeptidase/acylaminoacyl peptidase